MEDLKESKNAGQFLTSLLNFGSYNLGSRGFSTVAGGVNEARTMGDGEALVAGIRTGRISSNSVYR